jgi:Glycosyl transferase family 2
VPRISILLPTHNRADVIGFAIASALRQTTGDFELLVVGDGCSDGTAEVVQGFGDERIHWYDLPKGPGFGYENRNVALRHARGELVAYLAHDDLWFPDHLERMAGHFEDPKVQIAYSRTLWIPPDGMILPITFNLYLPENIEPFLKRQINCIASANVMHRRACFERVGYWNSTIEAAADLDMWARIIDAYGLKSMAFESTPTAFHFRAKWRTEANAAPSEIQVWRTWAGGGELIPPQMRLTTPDGKSQQEAALDLLGTSWADEVRKGSTMFLDRLASSFVHSLTTGEWRALERLRSFRRKAMPDGSLRHSIWIAIRR